MSEDSTLENRVYLFKDLASAWIRAHGAALGDPSTREHALRALADIAFVCATVADEDELSPRELAEALRNG